MKHGEWAERHEAVAAVLEVTLVNRGLQRRTVRSRQRDSGSGPLRNRTFRAPTCAANRVLQCSRGL